MPAVFREIFKDALVPYGDHRTLALFLNIMNRMEYDDSEKLGDAYEYLLKTAEAQADAGQFRTPRHIIDFIVNIINPQKHEVIIDPACGTAGFLVSACQHWQETARGKRRPRLFWPWPCGSPPAAATSRGNGRRLGLGQEP